VAIDFRRRAALGAASGPKGVADLKTVTSVQTHYPLLKRGGKADVGIIAGQTNALEGAQAGFVHLRREAGSMSHMGQNASDPIRP
jgi:hypothetical protein